MARSDAADPRAPLAYSDYLLQQLIGSGQMGKVYRARQLSLDRPVAVKYLRKRFLQHSDIVERFITEAQTVGQLNHPGIVGIHGLGRTPAGGYFIVMDLVDGPNLADIIQESDGVAVADSVEWIRQACDAIDHAHQRGIIHCDLKPGNLLLDGAGRILVTDFGLARSIVDDSTTRDGSIEGTAPFMAPEQVSPHWGIIGPQTDVYGLGAVLYTLLTRIPPFHGRTVADVLSQAISAAPVTPPPSIRLDIPGQISSICMRCLARNPEERFGTVQELSAALANITMPN